MSFSLTLQFWAVRGRRRSAFNCYQILSTTIKLPSKQLGFGCGQFGAGGKALPLTTKCYQILSSTIKLLSEQLGFGSGQFGAGRKALPITIKYCQLLSTTITLLSKQLGFGCGQFGPGGFGAGTHPLRGFFSPFPSAVRWLIHSPYIHIYICIYI